MRWARVWVRFLGSWVWVNITRFALGFCIFGIARAGCWCSFVAAVEWVITGGIG